jgi:hypothetical protein
MRHYCTYFDRHYLYRGLALYESLTRYDGDAVLWILCYDDDSYCTLQKLNLPRARVISLAEFEKANPELVAVKPTRQLREYYWTSTSSLPLYVFAQSPDIDLVTYVDSDLFFYSPPQPIFDELADRSIMLIEHRYSPEREYQTAISGLYNVGLMIFRRDANGLESLHWWRERCLEWCYARAEDGKFGDQKYLDDWMTRFDGVAVLRHPGAGIAPWNLTRFPVRQVDRRLLVEDRSLIFYHFHAFSIITSFLFETVTPTYRFDSHQVKLIYNPYVLALRRAIRSVANVNPDFKFGYNRRGPRSLIMAALTRRLMVSFA